MEHREEYTVYPCSGKKYNGEKAIISLTSWKARINICHKAILSLLKNCPDFHIVLVLSEEEFPLKENELPISLTNLINDNLIELLWVYKNYRSFKKVLFTMDKYKEVPIICADDDCIYNCNYAEELYDKWLNNKACVITTKKDASTGFQHGISSLYPPHILNTDIIRPDFDLVLNTNHDDVFIGMVLQKNGIRILDLGKKYKPYFQQPDNEFSLRTERKKNHITTKKIIDIIKNYSLFKKDVNANVIS